MIVCVCVCVRESISKKEHVVKSERTCHMPEAAHTKIVHHTYVINTTTIIIIIIIIIIIMR